MDKQLKGKKVVITGAGSGIGQATALILAQAGADVIIVSKSQKHLDQTATKLIALAGGDCTAYKVNLEKLAEIESFVKKLKQKFKTIDWLINCAGAIEHEKKLKDFSAMFTVNSLAPIYLTRLLTPFLNRHGGIINISSIAGIWGSPASPVYAASKAALNFYSQQVARQFTEAKSGLSCITIAPGRTNTPMRQKIAGDAKLYQGPEVIGQANAQIIAKESRFKNGDMVIVKDGQAKLYQPGD